MRYDTLRLAAALMIIAAVLHLIFVPFAGLRDLVVAGLALIAAAGLWTRMRALAWVMMLGLIVAMGMTASRLGLDPVPDALLYLLLLADLGAVVLIFVSLWRGRKVRA